jgi:WD40 repeat protein
MSYCLNPSCSSPQNQDDAEFCQCGTKLWLSDRYMAIKPIGQGGFGWTFLAVDLVKTEKPLCVIKQFFPNVSVDRRQAAQLFRQEAERLQQVDTHPQIPDFLDYVEQDEQQYLIQEFIDGQNLEQELRDRGAFCESDIRQLLMDLLPVLQFMHDHQVIHRDIKPANIIRCTTNQKLVLVDLGAAKLITGTALARTGTTIGSAEYAAPEQTRGKPVFASDIYSLGATCIHLLTQMSPFDLYDTSDGRWLWRDYLNQPVSVQLAQILDKMLENATSRRYYSVAEILGDIQPISPSLLPVEQVPTLNQPIAYAEKSIALVPDLKFDRGGTATVYKLPGEALTPLDLDRKGFGGRRFNWLNVSIGLVIAVCLGLPLAALWTMRDQSIRTIEAGDEVDAIAITPDGQTIAGSFTGNIFQKPVTAARIELWNLQTGASMRKWDVEPDAKFDTIRAAYFTMKDIAITPDGKVLVGGGFDGTVKLWNLQTGALIRSGFLPSTSEITAVTIAPNGQDFVTTSITEAGHSSLNLWSLETAKPLRVLQMSTLRDGFFAISPDGKTIAVNGCEDTFSIICLQDLRTGERIKRLRPDNISGDYEVLAYSPDGKLLVGSQRGAQVDVWNLQTGTQAFQIDVREEGWNAPLIAISPNSPVLAVGYDNSLQLWNLTTGKQIRTLQGHQNEITEIVFSSNGKTLVSGDRKGKIKIWAVP